MSAGVKLHIPRVGVIIPAFNEQQHIGGVVKAALQYVKDVVVIDDGSEDDTSIVAEENGASIVRLLENQGKGNALNLGFQYAIRKNWTGLITMDADGQHDPTEIPAFLSEIEDSQADVILGNRMVAPDVMPFVRYMTNKFMSHIISRLCGQVIQDTQCGFRYYNVSTLKGLNISSSRYDAESEILVQLSQRGYKIQSLAISTIYGDKDQSKIDPVIDTIRFIKLLSKIIDEK